MYRASRRANIACKEAIEASISEHYRDNRLDKDAVPQVIERFGYTRTLYVLANTVQQKEWDGRFSPANRAWAKTVDIPPNPDGFGGERNLDFVVDSHPRPGRSVSDPGAAGLSAAPAADARRRFTPRPPGSCRSCVPRMPPTAPTAPTTWPAFRRIS